MVLAGLTGGIASGKSLVARHFKRLGAYLIDADELARRAIVPGTSAWSAIRDRFGARVVAKDGTIDRKALGEIVFADADERTWLNSIVHPEVFRLQEEKTLALSVSDPKAVVIYDAALLIETGAYQRVDKVILVAADPATQIKRMMDRDGLTRGEAEARIGAQAPVEDKKRHADYVIDGTLSPEAVESAVERIYGELKALA